MARNEVGGCGRGRGVGLTVHKSPRITPRFRWPCLEYHEFRIEDRKTDRVKAVASNPDQSPVAETVGVGIVLKPSFQSDTFLALVVHSLVPGSSAEQSRMIQAGDILHSINDADVYRRPANEAFVAKRLLGRPGTTVKLGLLRLVSDSPPPEGTVLKPFPESLVKITSMCNSVGAQPLSTGWRELPLPSKNHD
eukprot:768746-Hanusia_phi.AAC.4